MPHLPSTGAEQPEQHDMQGLHSYSFFPNIMGLSLLMAATAAHTLSGAGLGGSANTDTALRPWGLGRAGPGAGGVGVEAAAAAHCPGCCWAAGLGFAGGGGGGGGGGG